MSDLFTLDIEIGPNNLAKLRIIEGTTPIQLAQQFAIDNNLGQQVVDPIAIYITEQIQERFSSKTQQFQAEQQNSNRSNVAQNQQSQAQTYYQQRERLNQMQISPQKRLEYLALQQKFQYSNKRQIAQQQIGNDELYFEAADVNATRMSAQSQVSRSERKVTSERETENPVPTQTAELCRTSKYRIPQNSAFERLSRYGEQFAQRRKLAVEEESHFQLQRSQVRDIVANDSVYRRNKAWQEEKRAKLQKETEEKQQQLDLKLQEELIRATFHPEITTRGQKIQNRVPYHQRLSTIKSANLEQKQKHEPILQSAVKHSNLQDVKRQFAAMRGELYGIHSSARQVSALAGQEVFVTERCPRARYI